MSQSKKQGTEDRSAEKRLAPKAIDSDQKGRRARFIFAAVVIGIILVIIGVFHYQYNIAPFRRTVITVDDVSIRMDYFLKRTKLAGVDSMVMLESLTNEQLIKLVAPRYVGEVSPEDIDQELRRIARGRSETITESEFKEWYRQQLNETGLSDSEYKEIIATNLLAARLYEYLAKRVPTVAEQVHLHAILLETYEDAEKVRARWEAGEDFADLAREVSLGGESRGRGGELGWFPRGVLDFGFDYVVFNLDIGDVSEPLPTEDSFYLIMVSEKAVTREIDEDSLRVLRSRALEKWLLEEIKFHDVRYNFNSEINAWINWKLAKTLGK